MIPSKILVLSFVLSDNAKNFSLVELFDSSEVKFGVLQGQGILRPCNNYKNSSSWTLPTSERVPTLLSA